jgi:Na+/H+-dicarboxylate symporter
MKLPSLNIQILSGAVLGVAGGLYFHTLGAEHHIVQGGLYGAGLIGTLFIDLLKMILIPLVFCSISVGIANLRQHQQMHRVWVITLLFFISSMAIAIALGMLASLYFKPGTGLHLAMFDHAMQNFEAKQLPLPEFFAQFLHGLFVNPFTALSQGNVLAVVTFALILGISLVVGGERFNNIRMLLQEVLEITMLIVGWVMRLAPLGIMALLIKLVAAQDVAMLNTLAKFVAIVIGTTLLHGVVILPLILYLFTGKSPLWFWRGAREALVTAFATSSSSATLPVTLRCTTQ